MIRYKLTTTYSRKKSYADYGKRPFEFEVADQVYLKISPMKGVIMFCKKGKLNPGYICPYEIL